jgi:hypothetical protein
VMAYYTPYPTGAFITTLSFGAYVLARGVRRFAGRSRPLPVRAHEEVPA